MTLHDWQLAPWDWNHVQLGDILLPGLAQVTTSRGREIDFKKAPSKDGGTSTDKGANAGKVKIRVTLTAKQWPQFAAIIPHIEPRDGKPTGPLSIVHPDPNSRGINVIEVKDIASSPPTAKGGIVYDIECQQWFPRPKDTKKKTPEYGKIGGTSNIYTDKRTDQQYYASLLEPSGLEALEFLEQSLGPPARQGVTILEDPVAGTAEPVPNA